MTPNFRRIVYITLAEADALRARATTWCSPSDRVGVIGTRDSGVDYYIRAEDLAEYAARMRTT